MQGLTLGGDGELSGLHTLQKLVKVFFIALLSVLDCQSAVRGGRGGRKFQSANALKPQTRGYSSSI